MLDAIRYLIVWQPLILTGLHFVVHWSGLDDNSTSGASLSALAPAPGP